MGRKERLFGLVAAADRWLKRIIGEENAILYHFARLTLAAVAVAVAVAVVAELLYMALNVVLSVVGAFITVLPYLLAIAVIAGAAVVLVYTYRNKWSKPSEVTPPSDAQSPESAPEAAAEAVPEPPRTSPEGEDAAICQALLAADAQTRSDLQAVLVSLERFDKRLQLVISTSHYIDLVGDNWAHVRQFVESSQGQSVPEASAVLVEIMILYKRAQDVRWVPINHERIHAWWGEAARRRRWLSEMFQESAASADRTAQGKAGKGEKAATSTIPQGRRGPAPKLSAPPTLDELLRYYEWTNQSN